MKEEIKIETLHLFSLLDKMLIDLLQSLTEEEWRAQTVAKHWNTKDVAAHLLDGNLRGLSVSRDHYFGEQTVIVNTYQDLVALINNQNIAWTTAAKRLSPVVLIHLLETTGKQYTEHLKSLSPFENAVFSVAWAGQETSPNWFHIAREYTEKFLHQQQIREAVGKQGIMTKELFYPFLDTFMYAFPHTFKDVKGLNGTTVSLVVTTEIGGQWNIVKTDNEWRLNKQREIIPNSKVVIDPHTVWKLFSKSWTPEQVMDKAEITGDRMLGEQALKIVAVMA